MVEAAGFENDGQNENNSDLDKLDFSNFKGIYFGDNTTKY